MVRCHIWLGCLCLLGNIALSICSPKLQIFEPQAGAEYAKDQEVVISLQGEGFPKNDRRADLLLDGKKLRDLPLPKKDGAVFNITLTGVKKGKHSFEVVLYHKKDVLEVWGSFFFIGSETARIRSKLIEGRNKAGTKQWAADSYLTWLQNKGGEAENVRVEEVENGIGLFAGKDFAQGDVIAEVPYVATLGPESASKSFFSEFLLMLYGDKDLPGQFASAIHLIVEADADGSFIEPMIRTLPVHEELNVAISWDRHDFSRAVQAVPALSKMGHDIQVFFENGYDRFWTVLDMNEKIVKRLKKSKKLPKYSLFTRANMVWALSIILTKAMRCAPTPPVKLEGFTNNPVGLFRVFPVADLANIHAETFYPYPLPKGPIAEGRLFTTVNNTEARAIITSTGDIPAGAQIYVSYGEMDNTDYLVGRGFILRPNLLDVPMPYPSWVPGLYVQHSAYYRQIRLSHVAPGAPAWRFAAILNVTLAEGGEAALRTAMDELFDAAVVHVPLDDAEDETCGSGDSDKEECREASPLVKSARYIARINGKMLTAETHEDIAKAWESVRSAVVVPDDNEGQAQLPPAPGAQAEAEAVASTSTQ